MEYAISVLILICARGLDLLTTRLASPDLSMEANPIAKRMGWKGAIIFNVIMVLVIPLIGIRSAIVVAVIYSVMAAINNARIAEMKSLFKDQRALLDAIKASHQNFARSIQPIALEAASCILLGACLWWALGIRNYGLPFIIFGVLVFCIRTWTLLSNWEPKKEEPTQSI